MNRGYWNGSGAHFGDAAGKRKLCNCAQCGYRITEFDEAATVFATGDRIHVDCWDEYAADNADEFIGDSEAR